jgi:dihydroorotate dehydrogenase electron transfer subunit
VRTGEARVVERREPAPGLVLLWLSAPVVSRGARPGQFVMLHIESVLDPFLPRAFWIHRLRDGDEGEEFAVLIEGRGRGTALIGAAGPGQRLRVTGPLGRPLPLAPGVRSLLLIGEGVSVSPLVWCSDEETARGRSVTLLLGAETAARLYPLDLVRPEVEVATATHDGSAGVHGRVTSLVGDYAIWADQIIAAGPDDLYRDLAERLRGLLWRRPCHVLANTPMPCGTGLCGLCSVETRRKGMRLACREGPAFELRDVV